MIAFRPGELHVLRKRPRLTTSEWAEQNRVLTRGPAPGPWRGERNPATVGIMNAIDHPSVREVIVMKAVQVGASDAVYNYLGHVADRSTGADMALIVFADEKGVKKAVENRLKPMFANSPSLRSIHDAENSNLYRVATRVGFQAEIGWSTSENSLSSESYKYVILDEFDKFKSLINAQEACARTRTFEDAGKKIVMLSNPNEIDGPINTAFERADAQLDFFVPCHRCGQMQVMTWAGFRWPGDGRDGGEVAGDPKRIKRERSGWYECEVCQAKWTDFNRDTALKAGEWRPRQAVEFPYSVAFHLPSWSTPFISLSHVIASRLEAETSSEGLRSWHSKIAGLPFSSIAVEELTAASVLYSRRYQWQPDGSAWCVPQRCCLLVSTFDVQDNRLEGAVWGFGPGHEIWLINKTVIPGSPAEEGTLQRLDEYISQAWQHESGAMLRPASVGIDTGGSHTRVIYEWLRRHAGRRIYGIKGASRADVPLTQWSIPKRQQRRHVPLLLCNTVSLKNDVYSSFRVEEPGAGFLHLPAWISYEDCEQLVSEHPTDQRDRRGNRQRIWSKIRPSARNELLDLLVYSHAIVHALNPNWEACAKALEPKKEKEEPKPQPPQTPRPNFATSYRKSPRGNFATSWR